MIIQVWVLRTCRMPRESGKEWGRRRRRGSWNVNKNKVNSSVWGHNHFWQKLWYQCLKFSTCMMQSSGDFHRVQFSVFVLIKVSETGLHICEKHVQPLKFLYGGIPWVSFHQTQHKQDYSGDEKMLWWYQSQNSDSCKNMKSGCASHQCWPNNLDTCWWNVRPAKNASQISQSWTNVQWTLLRRKHRIISMFGTKNTSLTKTPYAILPHKTYSRNSGGGRTWKSMVPERSKSCILQKSLGVNLLHHLSCSHYATPSWILSFEANKRYHSQ